MVNLPAGAKLDCATRNCRYSGDGGGRCVVGEEERGSKIKTTAFHVVAGCLPILVTKSHVQQLCTIPAL